MAFKPLDDRSIERLWLAASRVQTTNHRDAAIIGGIVTTLIHKRKLDVHYAKRAAHAAMDWGRRVEAHMAADYGLPTGQLPNVSMPTDEEMQHCLAVFCEQYDPGGPEGVAA